MRTYEVTVKTPAIYAREGAGKVSSMKLNAPNQRSAARAAVGFFQKEQGSRDMIGRTIFLTIVRVN